MFGQIAGGLHVPKIPKIGWNSKTGFDGKNPDLVVEGKGKDLNTKELEQTTFLVLEAIMALSDVESESKPCNILKAIALLHPEVEVRKEAVKNALVSGERNGMFKLKEQVFEYEEDVEYENEYGEIDIGTVTKNRVVRTYFVDYKIFMGRDHLSKYMNFCDNLMMFARVRQQNIRERLKTDPSSLSHRSGFVPDPLLDPERSKSNIVTVPIDDEWINSTNRSFNLNKIGMSALQCTGMPSSGLSHIYVIRTTTELPDIDETKPKTYRVSRQQANTIKTDPLKVKVLMGAVGGNIMGRTILSQKAFTADESEVIRQQYEHRSRNSTLNGMTAEYLDLMQEAGPAAKRESFTVSLY